jgi:hypothetical protein
MNRFHKHAYEPCAAGRPAWKALSDDAIARARLQVRQLRGHWAGAAGACNYVLLSGQIGGGSKSDHRPVMTADEVVGVSKRAEGFTVEQTLGGEVVTPKYVHREVVKPRDDMIAVLDTTDPLAGVHYGTDGAWVLGACTGTAKTRSRADNRSTINALAIRPIAIANGPTAWDWTAWGLAPRRTVSGELEHSTGTKVVVP